MRKLLLCLCIAGSLLYATIFGKIQGIVHDPRHRPLTGATVKLQAITSDWSQSAQSNDNGEFSFTTVPVGDYKITVAESKFANRYFRASRASKRLPDGQVIS